MKPNPYLEAVRYFKERPDVLPNAALLIDEGICTYCCEALGDEAAQHFLALVGLDSATLGIGLYERGFPHKEAFPEPSEAAEYRVLLLTQLDTVVHATHVRKPSAHHLLPSAD